MQLKFEKISKKGGREINTTIGSLGESIISKVIC